MIKKNNNKKRKTKIKREKITVYFVLRFLVIVCMVAQGMHSNWNNVFLCILTLILFTFPTLISKKFNIELPTTLEAIVYLFIFSAEILGEIQNFYGIFPHWDTMLHTLNGFLCAAIGFSLIDILNRSENVHISLSPIFVALVAFCFSMTIGVLWEFGEFSMDRYFKLDMQKDRIITEISSVKINKEKENDPVKINNIDKTVIYNNETEKIIIENGYLDIGIIDTMKDLFVNFIGAIVFSIIGFLYIENRDGYGFAQRFIPKIKKDKSTI